MWREREKDGRRIGYAWGRVNHNMKKILFIYLKLLITLNLYMAFFDTKSLKLFIIPFEERHWSLEKRNIIQM